MRAVVIDGVGGPDTVRLADLPVPTPGSGEVLVQVAYAGMNPADWKTREGWLSMFFDYQYPFVLGYDLSGTVAAVGSEVTGFNVGDRVAGYSQQVIGQSGSWAEFALSDHRLLAKVPDHLDLAVAAAVPVPGVTAFEALYESGRIQAGQRVLVHGGSGGVGSFAVQLARHTGAEVAATCSAPNAEYVRGLGADRVIDYRSESIVEAVRAWAPEGVDLVVDAVGQGTFLEAIEITRAGGCIAPIATLDFSEPAHSAEAGENKGVRLIPTMSNNERCGIQLGELLALVADGHIKAPALEVVPLDDVREGLDRIQTGHIRGKLVLEVGGESTPEAPAMPAVTVVDEVVLSLAATDPWLARWRADYLPGAEQRGMVLAGIDRRFEGGGQAVRITWNLSDPYAFFMMRGIAAADPAVHQFWAETDAAVVSRRRHTYAQEVGR